MDQEPGVSASVDRALHAIANLRAVDPYREQAPPKPKPLPLSVSPEVKRAMREEGVTVWLGFAAWMVCLAVVMTGVLVQVVNWKTYTGVLNGLLGVGLYAAICALSARFAANRRRRLAVMLSVLQITERAAAGNLYWDGSAAKGMPPCPRCGAGADEACIFEH